MCIDVGIGHPFPQMLSPPTDRLGTQVFRSIALPQIPGLDSQRQPFCPGFSGIQGIFSLSVSGLIKEERNSEVLKYGFDLPWFLWLLPELMSKECWYFCLSMIEGKTPRDPPRPATAAVFPLYLEFWLPQFPWALYQITTAIKTVRKVKLLFVLLLFPSLFFS